MRQSQSSDGSASGSSYSTGGASSIISQDNAEALTALHQNGDEREDIGQNDQGAVQVVFGMIYTLTKNKTLNTSIRLAIFQVVVEFIQFFLVMFNTTKAWHINTDNVLYKAIQWVMFKSVLVPKGYGSYITLFYVMAVVSTLGQVAAVWIAVKMRGGDTSGKWMDRLTYLLQLMAWTIFTFWPCMLDYYVFAWDCQWTNLASGGTAWHIHFPEQNCLAFPHLGHMLYSAFGLCNFGGMIVLWTVGSIDMNPLTRSLLASSDIRSMFRIAALKVFMVAVGTGLDCLPKLQAVFLLLAVTGVSYYIFWEVPYYSNYANMVYCGIWSALLGVSCMLMGVVFTADRHADDAFYVQHLTQAVLYLVFPLLIMGALSIPVRTRSFRKAAEQLHRAYHERRIAALPTDSRSALAVQGQPNTGAVVALGDLKSVYRFKDVTQLSVLCREMRKWDEDGIPDPDAADYGEFVLKCGLARMPNSAIVLVMYASLLIETNKMDAQAANTQLQLAQKANPSLFERMQIYMTQQLVKSLKHEGDGLDLLGYVEYQRNYRACVRAHKVALMAQRQFWNSLLRDTVHFVDLQMILEVMAKAEDKATSTYRRVMEHYPNDGKLLKVYGRFLEYVRNDPWSAGKFYAEASKYGTAESLLKLAQGQSSGNDILSATGKININEKVDGLMIVSAQGSILMVNPAALAMFGYSKGELEGKSMGVLMPPPFSSHHNTFITRYLETGVPHILNTTRPVLGLHKDRSIFPISLLALKLSGNSTDTLFLGVMRHMNTASMAGSSVVRFWVAPSGMILCADSSSEGLLGTTAAQLIGHQFSNLCMDSEAVQEFLSKSASSAEDSKPQMQVKMLHAYLPALDVELTIEFGGAIDPNSECRFIIAEARPLADGGAVMALSHKGKVVYATEKLAAMLGYPVATLVKMDINNLLPPPYSQMHGVWFRNLNTRPNPSSCRAGAVVHMLAANGTKVPVTLKMSTKEGSEVTGLLHIVHVEKASDAQLLDQRCLLLSLNHKGTILDVNSGAPKRLFGFNPADIIGRPVASVVDVFGLWRNQFGEDSSLLTLLFFDALKSGRDAVAADKRHVAGSSWRVGVHLPVKSDDEIASHAAQLAAQAERKKAQDNGNGGLGIDILQVLQHINSLHPACMSVAMLDTEGRLLDEASAAETTPVVQVSLYRSDAVTSIIELDKDLRISHSDDALSLMFGISHKAMHKKPFPRLIGLPTSTTFEDLLGIKGTAGAKKGAMRAGTAGAGASGGASRMGIMKKLTARHLGDGQPLNLEMQAMSYEQAGKQRLLVHLKLVQSSSASFPALIKFKQTAVASVMDGDHMGLPSVNGTAELPDSETESDNEAGGVAADGHVGHKSLAKQRSMPRQKSPDAGAYTQDWVRQAAVSTVAARGSFEGSRGALRDDDSEAEAAVHVRAYPKLKTSHEESPDAEQDEKQVGKWALERRPSAAESASERGSASGGDGASEGAGDNMSEATGITGVQDEEVAVDTRRAKRLKKLHRMMLSNVARVDSNRWRNHTLVLLAIIIVAHIVSYVILTASINTRYQTAYKVAEMASGVDKILATIMRSIMIQRCYLPKFQNWPSGNGTNGTLFLCSDPQMKIYYTKLQSNIELANLHHTRLYLGTDKLKPFADPRIYEYWTHNELPELRFHMMNLLPNGTTQMFAILPGKRPLWDMGNMMIAYARDVLFNAPTWKEKIGATTQFNYLALNGISMFNGYSWSLDTLVDYAWTDLLKLSVLLLVLLILEVLFVQLSCLLYEFYLLLKCNMAHIRLFSVFLALPSATVRIMAQRQLQLDDDVRGDDDDDEMDADMTDQAAAAASTAAAELTAGPGAESAAAAADKKKSVRMVPDLAEENGDDDDMAGHATESRNPRRSATGASSKSRSKRASQEGSAKKKVPLTGFAKFKHVAYKTLFGWMDPKFKRNGKKLQGNSSTIFKFMVPLILWLVALVAISAVSYKSLTGLQGPLASLDTATHVLYHLSICRVYGNMLAFGTDDKEKMTSRYVLQQELTLLKTEYNILLYGGKMILKANVTFDPVAPAGVFSYGPIADLFFKTKDCLRRQNRDLCYNDPAHPYYAITHSGLDAIVNRYIEEMSEFASLPPANAVPTHDGYIFAHKVGANDLYEGLQTAADLFLDYTISRFEAVKKFHLALLIISLVAGVLFIIVLYRPYIRRLHRDTKAIVGMLSQLPAEVDVETHVKNILLGTNKPAGDGDGQLTLLGRTGSVTIPPQALNGPGGLPIMAGPGMGSYAGGNNYGSPYSQGMPGAGLGQGGLGNMLGSTAGYGSIYGMNAADRPAYGGPTGGSVPGWQGNQAGAGGSWY